MSAYIVDKQHVVYLVKAAQSVRFGGVTRWFREDKDWCELRASDYERAAEVANMIWQENMRSVSHRYPRESSATLPGPRGGSFVVTVQDIQSMHWDTFNPVQVLKSIHCLNYQSCEHTEWEKSESYAFLKALEHKAIQVLPGFEKAEWGSPEPEGCFVCSH